MSVAPAKKSSTKRTLLFAALGVILLDAIAIVMFGGVGLNNFPGDVIKRSLEPIVPHTVIDLGGVIVAVNDRWQQFAVDNGVQPGEAAPNTGVGSNYFAVCGPGTGACEGAALNASTGLRAVLEGRLPSFSLDYPCDSPTQARWFVMTVMP